MSDSRDRKRRDLYGEPDPRPHRRWYAGDRGLRNAVGGAVLAVGLVLLVAGDDSLQIVALGLLTIGALWALAALAEAIARR